MITIKKTRNFMLATRRRRASMCSTHSAGSSSSSSESMGLCFLAFGKSLGFFTSAMVFFPFCVCGLCSCCRDTVVPRLLTPHPHVEWPEAGSAALFREKVQQVGAAGRHVEVHVEVFAHEIWTFVVFWSDLVAQLTAMVPLIVMREGFTTGTVTGSWLTPVALDRCRCLPSCGGCTVLPESRLRALCIAVRIQGSG